MTGCRYLLAVGALVAAGVPIPARGGEDPAALIREIDARSATLGAPLAVSNLELETQAAAFDFVDGLLFPASTVGGETVEMVFIGRGRVRYETADFVEMDHLELHTGQRILSTHFTEAVLVVTAPGLRELLLGSAPASAPAGARGVAAQKRYQNWLKSGERRLLGVDAGLFRAAVGEPGADTFFAAWLGGTEWQEIWYSEDPDNEEMIAVGRFVPLDLQGRERRKVDRELAREKRRGRLQALSPEDVGHLEQWVSTTAEGVRGSGSSGDAAFEPDRYVIDATIDSKVEMFSGTTDIHLRARQEGRRSVRLRLGVDFKIEAIEDGNGTPLAWLQTRGTIMVLLPTPAALGAEVLLRVKYSGAPFDRARRDTYSMRDTVEWHPHAGHVDRATYDVTIHWPWSLTLAASGRKVDGGRGEGTQWERRRLDFPAIAFGFEVGGFEFRQVQAGHLRVNMAYGRGEESALTYRQDEIEAEIVDILSFYEETFGPLPLDEITVATLPRAYAQGLLGFLTIASSMIDGREAWENTWRTPDRRTYLAHELAHQWWGNLVGWRSYRDQWLSEALAHHSVMLYSSHRLDEEHRYKAGPIASWDRILLENVQGRTVESVGPVVLGQRLNSVQGVDAYDAIVYVKGALIMGMLTKRFVEEGAFSTMLSHLVKAARNKPISTEEFLAALERMSGADLDTFAAQFIYGTGLPIIVYDYSVSPAGAGTKAAVKGEARLFPPPAYRFAVEPLPGGGFDVRRQPAGTEIRDGLGLIMPFQVDLAKGYMHGRLLLRGPVTPFQFESEQTPKKLRLDPRGETLSRSLSLPTLPKLSRLQLGRLLRASGEDEKAEAALMEARRETDLGDMRAIPAVRGFLDWRNRRHPSQYEHQKAARNLDLEILTELAQIRLDQGRLAEARGVVVEMETLMGRRIGFGYDHVMEGAISKLEDGEEEVNAFTARLKARLDLLEGRPAEVLKTFRQAVESWEWLGSGENYAMLAIAAHQTGDAKAFRDYREKARAGGVDMTALTAAPVPSPAVAPGASEAPTPLPRLAPP